MVTIIQWLWKQVRRITILFLWDAHIISPNMTPKRPRMHSQRSTALALKNYLWIFIFTLTTLLKEKNPFAEFCHLRDQDYCKILKFHSVRWLAMTICIKRMIKLFPSLQNYCLSLKTQYIKYARIRVFTDPYSPV